MYPVVGVYHIDDKFWFCLKLGGGETTVVCNDDNLSNQVEDGAKWIMGLPIKIVTVYYAVDWTFWFEAPDFGGTGKEIYHSNDLSDYENWITNSTGIPVTMQLKQLLGPLPPLVGWWKGEDNTNNEVVGGDPIEIQEDIFLGVPPPAYDSSGFLGSCFVIGYAANSGPLQYQRRLITPYYPLHALEFVCYLKGTFLLTDLMELYFLIGYSQLRIGYVFGEENFRFFVSDGDLIQEYVPPFSPEDDSWHKMTIRTDGINRIDILVDDILLIPDNYIEATLETSLRFIIGNVSWRNDGNYDVHATFKIDEIKLIL
jgi:hypothetical protein